MGEIWNTLILQPMLNVLVVFYHVLFANFGITIIVFTVIIRVLTLPLTVKQVRSTKAMAEMQPKLQEIQKKYANDKGKLSQEMMKLYREAGINPLGCIGPMVIQMPIWIALYQSIIGALAASPESLLSLSQKLYSWPIVFQAIPLKESFLWLDLVQPDKLKILPVLVGATMWVQQKMVTAPTTDPRQRQTSSMMLWMMPIMFAFFTLSFPSGLGIYWVISNIAGIVIQYLVSGWGYLVPKVPVKVMVTLPPPAALPVRKPKKRK